MANISHCNFPFTAVAGQESLKLALTLTAINPRIGGVIVSGPRGSAKSTLARGLAGVMPHMQGESLPFVTLPLGATEDRLLGSLDIEAVLQDKSVQFHPGLLAQAHQGVLYVDEVNLLADSLVDLLLDVSASGINRVERDGVSHEHEARFVLIGTMNPEEGELRPQLKDRFGLMVELSNQYALEERVQIVRLRDEYDQDPQAFCDAFKYKQRNLRQTIQQARERLAKVKCADALRMDIASRCQDAQVDGVRADIVWVRAAMTHAAWRGADVVAIEDVKAVENFVLAHRRKPQLNTPAPSSPPPSSRRPPDSRPEEPTPGKSLASPATDQGAGDWGGIQAEEQVDTHAMPFSYQHRAQQTKLAHGMRQALMAGKQKGKVSGGSKQGTAKQALDIPRTLVANQGQWPPEQLKYKRGKQGKAQLHMILLDTSASALAEQSLSYAKGVIFGIAQQAYLHREQIALMGFGGEGADLLMAQVRAPQDIQPMLEQIKAGGGTPIHQALQDAARYLEQCQQRQPELDVQVYILTDGRVTGAFTAPNWRASSLVIDIEQSAIKRGRANELAQTLQSDYLTLSELSAGGF